MVAVDFSGNFTNAENCKDQAVGVILTEGEAEEKEGAFGKYIQLSIKVEVDGKQLVHSPRNAEGKELVKAWGSETKNWIGKKFKCLHITYQHNNERKKRVEIEPLKE